MTSSLAVVASCSLFAGLILIIAGARRVAIVPAPKRTSSSGRLATAVRAWLSSPRRRAHLVFALAAGAVGWLFSGLLVFAIILPIAIIGMPALLRKSSAEASIEKLEAMEEWTRNLAGVLTVGRGLEQAIRATHDKTPSAIRPAVHTLINRISSRWDLPIALHAFADELDDSTGDVIATSLIVGAEKRDTGLAAVLSALAEAVAEDVRVRRAIEADRSKPRATARAVTLLTLVALGLEGLNRDFIHQYSSLVGQIALVALLSCYAGALLWMRQMSQGKPTPRILNPLPQADYAARLAGAPRAAAATTAGRR